MSIDKAIGRPEKVHELQRLIPLIGSVLEFLTFSLTFVGYPHNFAFFEFEWIKPPKSENFWNKKKSKKLIAKPI